MRLAIAWRELDRWMQPDARDVHDRADLGPRFVDGRHHHDCGYQISFNEQSCSCGWAELAERLAGAYSHEEAH